MEVSVAMNTFWRGWLPDGYEIARADDSSAARYYIIHSHSGGWGGGGGGGGWM